VFEANSTVGKWSFFLRKLNQIRQRDPKRFCGAIGRGDAEVPLAPLNQPKIRAVSTGLVSKVLE